MGKKLADQAGLRKDGLAAISNAAAAKRAEQDKRVALEQQLAIQDRQHAEELSDQQSKQAVIRDRLANSDLRLSVLLDATDSASGCNVPATPGSVGVAHAAR